MRDQLRLTDDFVTRPQNTGACETSETFAINANPRAARCNTRKAAIRAREGNRRVLASRIYTARKRVELNTKCTLGQSNVTFRISQTKPTHESIRMRDSSRSSIAAVIHCTILEQFARLTHLPLTHRGMNYRKTIVICIPPFRHTLYIHQMSQFLSLSLHWFFSLNR